PERRRSAPRRRPRRRTTAASTARVEPPARRRFPSRAVSSSLPPAGSPGGSRRTRRYRALRQRERESISTSFLLLSGRDRLDDADWVELRALCHERGIASRIGVEEEETDLVLGNVNRVFEPDAG